MCFLQVWDNVIVVFMSGIILLLWIMLLLCLGLGYSVIVVFKSGIMLLLCLGLG